MPRKLTKSEMVEWEAERKKKAMAEIDKFAQQLMVEAKENERVKMEEYGVKPVENPKRQRDEVEVVESSSEEKYYWGQDTDSCLGSLSTQSDADGELEVAGDGIVAGSSKNN